MKNLYQNRGETGELLAARHLKRQGYKILETNYRCSIGEIDIIAKDKGVFAFVEVKTRASGSYGHPKEAVNLQKQRKISMVALEYLKKNRKIKEKARFDVVAVFAAEPGKEKIEIIKNAFELAYP